MNCIICTIPERCDCLCSTCSNARYENEQARGKTAQSREYAAAHGIEPFDIKMSGPTPSYREFITRWVKGGE